MRTIHGVHGRYLWIEQIKDSGLKYEVLDRWPQIALHRCAVVTMFDCGPIEPNDKEVARGWYGVNGTLIIPCLENAHDIPATGCGDQIYVLDHPPVEPIAGEFMNSDAFTLESIEAVIASIKSVGEQIQQGNQFDDLLTPMQDQFWNTMENSDARAFLGDGVSQFIFVTDDETFHSDVLRLLLANSQ